jgi:hypothetical protein
MSAVPEQGKDMIVVTMIRNQVHDEGGISNPPHYGRGK